MSSSHSYFEKLFPASVIRKKVGCSNLAMEMLQSGENHRDSSVSDILRTKMDENSPYLVIADEKDHEFAKRAAFSILQAMYPVNGNIDQIEICPQLEEEALKLAILERERMMNETYKEYLKLEILKKDAEKNNIPLPDFAGHFSKRELLTVDVARAWIRSKMSIKVLTRYFEKIPCPTCSWKTIQQRRSPIYNNYPDGDPLYKELCLMPPINTCGILPERQMNVENQELRDAEVEKSSDGQHKMLEEISKLEAPADVQLLKPNDDEPLLSSDSPPHESSDSQLKNPDAVRVVYRRVLRQPQELAPKRLPQNASFVPHKMSKVQFLQGIPPHRRFQALPIQKIPRIPSRPPTVKKQLTPNQRSKRKVVVGQSAEKIAAKVIRTAVENSKEPEEEFVVEDGEPENPETFSKEPDVTQKSPQEIEEAATIEVFASMFESFGFRAVDGALCAENKEACKRATQTLIKELVDRGFEERTEEVILGRIQEGIELASKVLVDLTLNGHHTKDFPEHIAHLFPVVQKMLPVLLS